MFNNLYKRTLKKLITVLKIIVMSWDLSLLHKFSNTSHYRLLKQLKNELKASPLTRNGSTRELNVQNRQNRLYNSRTTKKAITTEASVDIGNQTVESKNVSQDSFRDRLNTVEMR